MLLYPQLIICFSPQAEIGGEIGYKVLVGHMRQYEQVVIKSHVRE